MKSELYKTNQLWSLSMFSYLFNRYPVNGFVSVKTDSAVDLPARLCLDGIDPCCSSLWLSARLARLLLFVGVIVMWVASTPIVADYMGLRLESWYPPVAVEATPAADAIVVLGGGVEGPAPPRITVELSDAADRVLHAARLYRAGKAPVVLLSGRAIPWLASDVPEAEAMQSLLEE
jgi:hypothetical protein